MAAGKKIGEPRFRRRPQKKQMDSTNRPATNIRGNDRSADVTQFHTQVDVMEDLQNKELGWVLNIIIIIAGRCPTNGQFVFPLKPLSTKLR